MKKPDLLLGIAIMMIWGINFSVIKLGVNNIDPLILTALRFFFAAVPLVFFIPRPQVKKRYLITYGLTFGLGVWGLTTWSIDLGLAAGLASLLLNLSVVSSLVLGWLFLHENITFNQLAGAALSLLGLLIIIVAEGGSISWHGLILILMASVFWSVNGVLVKMAKTDSIFAFNIWSMLVVPVPLILLAWITHGSEVVTNLYSQLNSAVLFSVFFQAYPTTLLGYWVWNLLVVKYSLSTVAPLTLLVPVFGILGGYVFYGETIFASQLFAAALIFSGLLCSQFKHFKPAKIKPKYMG